MSYLIFTTRQGQEIGRRRLEGPTVIGRSPECDVAIDDSQLSRRHCRLMESAEGWVLADLDSRNGTRFRGPRISSQLLRDGDVFQIGMINVIFRAGDSVDAPQAGVARPKRPATPLESADSTAAGFKFEPRPVSRRDADDFPVPIPMADDLDWLDVTGELLYDQPQSDARPANPLDASGNR